jgi:hypothetical protein
VENISDADRFAQTVIRLCKYHQIHCPLKKEACQLCRQFYNKWENCKVIEARLNDIWKESKLMKLVA